MRRPLRTAAVLTASAAALAVVLTGCVPASPSPTKTPGAGGSSTPSASSSSSASSSPDPTPSPTASSLPVAQTCAQLVSDQTVYDYGPIYSAKSPATPAAGTPAAQAKAAGGRACEWVNTSSGEVIDLSVARYDATTLTGLRDAASSGTAVSSWNADSAWFSATGGVGTASAVAGDHWIVARSTVFLSADDATAFMSSAVAAVK